MTNILSLPQLQATFAVTTNADWRDSFQFQYPASASNAGQPIDLTGISFRAVLRSSVGSTQALLDMSSDNGLLVNGGQLGTLTFSVPHVSTTGLSDDHMANLPSGPAVMDIVATGADPSGNPVTLNLFQVGGPAAVTVNQGVTR